MSERDSIVSGKADFPPLAGDGISVTVSERDHEPSVMRMTRRDDASPENRLFAPDNVSERRFGTRDTRQRRDGHEISHEGSGSCVMRRSGLIGRNFPR